MFRKTIAASLAAAMLVSASVYAADGVLKAEIDKDTVNVTVDCGAKYAGKMITVEVFEPESGFDALSSDDGKTYTNQNNETVTNAISIVLQETADENGKISFTYKPKGPRGRYYYRIGGNGVYTKFTGYFEFMTENDAENIAENLKAEPTLENIRKIFKKTESENVYTDYQILELDKEPFYEDFDKADDDTKEEIYNIILGSAANLASASDLRTAFTKAVHSVLMEKDEGDTLLALIDKAKDYTGFASTDEYKKIMQVSGRYTDKTKEDFAKRVAALSLKNLGPEEICAKLREAMLASALSNAESYGMLDELIRDFDDEISANGGETDKYISHDTPLNVAKEVRKKQPFDTVKAFADELNTVLGKKTDKTHTSTTSTKTGSSYTVPSTSQTDVTTSDITAGVAGKTLFEDLADAEWAEEAIAYLYDKNVINGKSENIFAPNDFVTREEFVKMLVLALNIEAAEDSDIDFPDVDAGEWYAPYIKTASAKGIVNGMGDRFGIGFNITREDMAVMCKRAADTVGLELAAQRSEPNFEDEISDYAREAVKSLYKAGVINGTGNNLFSASANATRAEAAKMIYGIIK